MTKKTATIIGATGLIGSYLYNLILKDDEYSEIRIISRRPLENDHPKVKVVVIDFADNEAYKSAIKGSDVVFCAIGTTSKKVKGDKTEYRKVDYDVPVNAAKFCKETGCEKFIFVSSVGASSKSKNFYLKQKGEVEDAVKSLSIKSAVALRPSLLLGDRKEFRFGEDVGKYIIIPLSILFPTNMKPIKALMVAKAMLQASKEYLMGYNVMHRTEMKKLSASIK
ncbi:MAG: NAD(P)H-binding protein [Desulfobulbaceae bacterium]|nr:NAD(P)H-binding protein [Desulfobulbaceae bacterium]